MNHHPFPRFLVSFVTILLPFSLATSPVLADKDNAFRVLPIGSAYRDAGPYFRVPDSSSINLVPNPSFEEGTTSPSYWDGDFFRGSASLVWDATTAHSGSRSLAIMNLVPQVDPCFSEPPCALVSWRLNQNININPSHDYMLSAWYKSSASPSSIVSLWTGWLNSSGSPLGAIRTEYLSPTDDWTYCSLIVSSSTLQRLFPTATQARIHFEIKAFTSESGGIWFDDISFVDMTSATYWIYMPLMIR